ncbi:motility associated factor glycosyltransferase family protein [Alkalispirochaeta alkalica]|uniref:motility associated factor glycosyltransferase family protein n=1 Tax=Alkalispirochaeta alkalica TaxID=46356 RepID=UPI000369E1FD|nr:6-hydroxymethylpterin diphosphokinase MptE-like protein [Alkalispirochaeta alkalica]
MTGENGNSSNNINRDNKTRSDNTTGRATAGTSREGDQILLEPTRSGEMTLRWQGRLLHSSVAPRREARRLAERILQDAPDALVILGIGLGYHLEELRLQAPSLPVALVEPSQELLDLAISHTGQTWWDRYGPDLVTTPDALEDITLHLNRWGAYNPALVVLQGVARHCPREEQHLKETLLRYRKRREVNRNTLRRFGRLWVRNTLRNLACSAGAGGTWPGIDGLAGIASGVPAIVCGAGPSLDTILSDLAVLQEQCLIIAVDTALKVLQREGIHPHCAVVADPQYWNTRHLDNLPSRERTLVVAEPATHPRVFRLWDGPGALAASLFPLGAFIDHRLGRTRKLGAGGSVATSAWDLARFMGAREIYLAGIDLGFPGSRTHCRGSFFEERLILRGSRLEPAEQGLYRYLHGAQAAPVPAARGGTIPSDARMEVYRNWFSEQNQRYPEITTRLLTPESSAIEGTGLACPTELAAGLSLTLPPEKAPLWKDPARALRTLPPSRNLPRREAPREILRNLEESLTRIHRIAREGEALCRTLKGLEELDPGELARLDEVDQLLASCSDRELAGFLAARGLEEAAARTPSSPREAVAQAEEIYQAIAGACAYHQDLLARYSPREHPSSDSASG